jgi:regulation of enolase protein 1 (concanavalin A-like superfamily)
VVLNGAGTPDATVTIAVPAGLSHDPWALNNAPRLMQPARDEDFQIEVKLESTMNLRFQEQGVIIEQDADNWLRVEFHSDGAQIKAFASATIDGVPSVKINYAVQPVPASVPMWLRVTRQGNTFTQEYSLDGETWSTAGSFSQPLAVSSVGIFGGNFNPTGDSPAHDAIFDYFFETSLPVVPEDTPAP